MRFVQLVQHWSSRTGLAVALLVGWLGIAASKFSRLSQRLGTPNQHNAPIPRDFWLEDWEKVRHRRLPRPLSPWKAIGGWRT